MISPETLGSTWRVIRCQSDAPSARLRSTYRRSLSVSTCARISRAGAGHDVIPMTRMMFSIDGPRIAASTMASGRNGMTRNHSVRRMRTASVQPPMKPAVIPTTEPMTMARTVAARPTSRLMRAPQMNCVSTLRPRWSVPSGPNFDGLAHAGLAVVLTACRPAESARSGAASAIATARTRMRQADHPRGVAAVLAPRVGGRVPAPQPGDPPGRDGDGAHREGILWRWPLRPGEQWRAVMRCAPADRGSRRAGRRAGWRRSRRR